MEQHQLVEMFEGVWTPNELDVMKQQVAKDASQAEFAHFLRVAEKRGLDPFNREIYAVPRAGRMTIQVGIDGYRILADRTGEYVGNDLPTFEVDGDGHPITAQVRVWRMQHGERRAYAAEAAWGEYCAGGRMWDRMPRLMLSKCAEALALRKAFPAALSGIYTTEEMAQADAPVPAFIPSEVVKSKRADPTPSASAPPTPQSSAPTGPPSPASSPDADDASEELKKAMEDAIAALKGAYRKYFNAINDADNIQKNAQEKRDIQGMYESAAGDIDAMVRLAAILEQRFVAYTTPFEEPEGRELFEVPA